MVKEVPCKAIFLDRDGTINIDTDHVFDPDKVSLIKGAAQAVGDFNRAGFKCFIITNQSCVGRGYATLDQVEATNLRVQELLLKEDEDARIEAIYIAPDHPEQASQRRKPSPGMILEAVENYQIDLISSWVIGDKSSDPMTGINAGIPESQCIRLFPNGRKDKLKLDAKDNFLLVPSLVEAKKIVLQKKD